MDSSYTVVKEEKTMSNKVKVRREKKVKGSDVIK